MSSPTATERDLDAVPVVHFDVGDAADLNVEAPSHAFVVARYHGEPLGTIRVRAIGPPIAAPPPRSPRSPDKERRHS